MASTKAQISQYFAYDFWSKVVGWTVGIGILCLFGSPGFGVFLIIIGIAIAKFKMIDTIPDESIEEAYKNFAEANFEKALEDGGIDESMLIQNSDWFWHVDDFTPNDKKWREGKDKITRANTRGIVILNYGKDQIFGWEVAHNIETGETSMENTSEFYYNDVVGIEITQGRTLTLRTSGGPKDYKLVGSEHDESGDITKGKAVVSAVRTMLRERKTSN